MAEHFCLGWAEQPVKGSKAYKNVPWFRGFDGGEWQCLLCQTGLMPTRDVLRAHCSGSRHQKKHAQLKAWSDELHKMNQRNSELNRIEILLPRVENLKHLKWRRYVKELLLDAVVSKCEFRIAYEQLLKYESWERLALLELVIWKHCCLSDDRFDSMQGIEDYWALDESFNPKQYKREARLSGDAGVILLGVKSFL